MNIEPVAHIYTDFPTKFGVPRQSGLVKELKGRIVFEPRYRDPEAVKGLSGFDYIWVLWDFSMAHRAYWSATVCPPRLGGKTHVGVFASRSPFRPNSIGLSSLKLDAIEYTDKGPVLMVSCIDMADGTPVYDIKPYIPRFDSHPDALSGFSGGTAETVERVEDPDEIIEKSDLSDGNKAALREVLAEDPRPRFDANDDGTRIYGFYFGGYDVRFTFDSGVITVREMVKQ